jgi:transposase InsO family protein
MPWQERSTVSNRLEFVMLAGQQGANVRELCRRFQISPKTGYKWLGRYCPGQEQAGLDDRSRRPASSPLQSAPELEDAVVRLRTRYPTWGGRKIARKLEELGLGVLAPSTVTSILHRYDLIDASASQKVTPTVRFEHESPNALWQMDFKGNFKTLVGRCNPLTILDDHSRFNLALTANGRTTAAHIQPQLEDVFRRYGMPVRINVDNGPPWGGADAVEHGLTELTVWMIRLGITVSHSRPHRPQTNGKIERFHRTLDEDVIAGHNYADFSQVQHAFDRWRRIYNFERPHEAIEMQTPVQRYQPSPFAMPQRLPEIEYRADDIVLQVRPRGRVSFAGREWEVSRALTGLPIAVRVNPDASDRFDLFFCHQKFGVIDLNEEPVDS